MKKENKSKLPDGWMDWNTLTLDQMVEHLRMKYMLSSSGDAKCIFELIKFYDKHKNIDVPIDKLSKDDAIIDIYDILEGDDYFSVDVRKDRGEYSEGFDGELLFQNELDQINIKRDGDEWVYYGDLNRYQLKDDLVKLGFRVQLM